MRICYSSVVELQLAGAPTNHTRGLCEALVRLGHDVDLLAPRCEARFRPRGARVHGVPFKGFSPGRLRIYSLFEALALLRLWLVSRPDLVIERETCGRRALAWL